MGIEEVRQNYNMERCLRDALPICDAEIQTLEEDPNVQKYIRLKEHQKKYAYLRTQSDEDILDRVIATDSETIEEDVYFCYGKGFLGHPKKIGGYYIEPNTNSIRRLQGTWVSKYRNLANPSDVVIIPTREADEFESTHKTIFYTTAVPDEEYHELRRKMYLEKLGELEQPKALRKGPQHD